MPMALRRCFAVLSLACAIQAAGLVGGSAAAVPAPRLVFEAQAVVATGLSPGGQVAWFSIAREIADYAATVVPRMDIAAVAGDGTARFALGRNVPFKSIWIAVDLASGAFASGSPAGFPLEQMGWRGAGLLHNATRADQIDEARSFVVVFLARPHPAAGSSANDGSGAWFAAVGQGSDKDDGSSTEGRVTVSLDRLQSVGRSPAPPSHLGANDVVAVIDPTFMEMVLVRAGPLP
jgi:hypothetical protein